MTPDFAALASKYDIDHAVAEIDAQIAVVRAAEAKFHKKLVTYQISEYKELPFKAILNSIELPCTLSFVCKHFLRTVMNIDRSSPVELRNIQMYQKIYFASPEAQEAYERCKRGDLCDFKFFSHSVAKSPAPLVVKHRQFYVMAKFCRVGDDYRIYMRSIPEQFAESHENALTGDLLGGYFKFSATANGAKIEQFLLADPAGQVPGAVYNAALGARNDVLLFAVQFLEQLKKEQIE